MRPVLALLTGGMLLRVSGQVNPLSVYNDVQQTRFTFPAYFATATMMVSERKEGFVSRCCPPTLSVAAPGMQTSVGWAVFGVMSP